MESENLKLKSENVKNSSEDFDEMKDKINWLEKQNQRLNVSIKNSKNDVVVLKQLNSKITSDLEKSKDLILNLKEDLNLYKDEVVNLSSSV